MGAKRGMVIGVLFTHALPSFLCVFSLIDERSSELERAQCVYFVSWIVVTHGGGESVGDPRAGRDQEHRGFSGR